MTFNLRKNKIFSVTTNLHLQDQWQVPERIYEGLELLNLLLQAQKRMLCLSGLWFQGYRRAKIWIREWAFFWCVITQWQQLHWLSQLLAGCQRARVAPKLGRDSLYVTRSYIFSSALEPWTLTVHREQHFSASFSISPSSPPCKPAQWGFLERLQVCQTHKFDPCCLGSPCYGSTITSSLCLPRRHPMLQGWIGMNTPKERRRG